MAKSPTFRKKRVSKSESSEAAAAQAQSAAEVEAPLAPMPKAQPRPAAVAAPIAPPPAPLPPPVTAPASAPVAAAPAAPKPVVEPSAPAPAAPPIAPVPQAAAPVERTPDRPAQRPMDRPANAPPRRDGAPGSPTGSGSVSSSDEQLDAETQARYEHAKRQDISIRDLQKASVEELHVMAKEENIPNYAMLKRHDLIFQVLKAKVTKQGLMYGEGVLEVLPDGFGFLRSPEVSYLAGPDDIYVSPSQIRRFGLKVGHIVQGTVRPPKESERYFALLRVDAINGRSPDALNDVTTFEDLTPLHPYQRLVMETTPEEIEMRIVDLVAPIGRGQRALIVAPPRTGKTVLLQKMANAIIKNNPEMKVIVLLIAERPEEVTDFRRHTPPAVEVVASSFDESATRHVQVCEMAIEKARRMVEFGEHVVILMDSLTRMARAYNGEMPHSGRVMTGGLDSNAMQRPKKFFGSARAIEKGGSLTIIATALTDTGSKMDDIIFEEFKGTGNSELHLDRRLMDKRIYPCIDIAASGTRREELLLDPREMKLVYRLRKVLADMNLVEAMELLKGRIQKVKTNAEFLITMSLD